MDRLKSHKDFVAVLKKHQKFSSRDIVFHYSIYRQLEPGSPPKGIKGSPVTGCRDIDIRLGLAVSKSVGNAVMRNTVKRRLRVLAKRYEGYLAGFPPAGPLRIDIVVRAKPSAAYARFDALDSQMEKIYAGLREKSAGYPADKPAA